MAAWPCSAPCSDPPKRDPAAGRYAPVQAVRTANSARRNNDSARGVRSVDSARGMISMTPREEELDRQAGSKASGTLVEASVMEGDAEDVYAENADGELLQNESDGKGEQDEFDIPADAYGAAILAIVQDVPRLFSANHQVGSDYYIVTDAIFNTCFGVGLLLLNLGMQFSLIGFIWLYVVQGDINIVQMSYRDYRANAFDHQGLFSWDLWDDWTGKEDLCQIGMTDRWFYYSVLLCWTFSCANEIRNCLQLIRDICYMPSCPSPEEQIPGELQIVALTAFSRHCCVWFVCVPKLVISLVLLWLGCEWLSATIRFESLVMNAVAMSFIVAIDEMLFEAVLPVHFRKQVEDINFVVVIPAKTDEEVAAENHTAYIRSIILLMAALVFVVFYAELLQNVLPTSVRSVKPLCGPVLSKLLTPICNGWTVAFRIVPVDIACYPAGGSFDDENVLS